MLIEVVFDTICPWCYIGKRRLKAALKLRPRIEATVRWRPFLLNPGMPATGIDRTAYLISKFGSESRVRRIYGAIAEAGQSVDIDFLFERIGHTPNTVNSHRLVRFADGHGKASAAVEALFLAYFVNGHNIGETDVLVALGTRLGLDADALGPYLTGDANVAQIHDENALAHRQGINGVPAFVFEGGYLVSGAQAPEVLVRMLDVASVAAGAA